MKCVSRMHSPKSVSSCSKRRIEQSITRRLLLGGVTLGILFLASHPAVAQKKGFDLVSSKDAPIAKYKDSVITAEEMAELVRNAGYPRPISWDTLGEIPVSNLEEFAKRIVSNRILAKRAKGDEKFERPATLENDMGDVRQRLLMQQLYKVAVQDNTSSPTEEELRKAYEDQKESFTTPFNFTMQHLYLSTYRDYTVQEGDTLESIAEKVAGDKTAVDQILSQKTKRTRLVDTESEDVDKDSMGPLLPGEILLVPMSKEKRAEVQKLIDDLYQKLEGGADFGKLAEEYSQAASKAEEVRITPSKENPMLDVIINAVKATPVGKYSEPFQTKHGWQILKVVQKQEETVKPYADVRASLSARLIRQKQGETASAFIDTVFAESQAIKVNLEALKETADPATVLIEVGPRRYTRQDLMVDFAGKYSEDMTEKDVRTLVKTIGRLQSAALMEEAEKMNLAQRPDVVKALEIAESNFIADAYVQWLLENQVAKMSDEDLKAFYDENKDRLFKEGRKLDLYVIGLSANPPADSDQSPGEFRADVQSRLKAWKEEIKDLQAFKKLASENSVVKPEESGHVGEVEANRYEGGFNGELNKVELKTVAGPLSSPSREFLVWAESETPEGYLPFEKNRETISKTYFQRERRDLETELRDGVLEEVEFSFLLLEAPEK